MKHPMRCLLLGVITILLHQTLMMGQVRADYSSGGMQLCRDAGAGIQCGADGISVNDCLKAGCCWDGVNPNATHRCNLGEEHRSPDSEAGRACAIARDRGQQMAVRSCGWPGTTWWDCMELGCCWTTRREKQTPRCFKIIDVSRVNQTGQEEGDLILGTSSKKNMLYMKVAGIWGLVCGAHFYEKEAQVACRQLGYRDPEYASIQRTSTNVASTRTWINFVKCEGSESRLDECEYKAWYHTCEDPFRLICTTTERTSSSVSLRLIGGPLPTRGRLEYYSDSVWRSVCDYGFGDREAQIACTQLDFRGGRIRPMTSYGRGRGIMWTDDVRCMGNETELTSCRRTSNVFHDCTHDNDVNIDCDPSPEVLGGDPCSSTVELSARSGEITSRQFPSYDRYDGTCRWRISVTPGKVILVEIPTVSLRYPNQNHQYLRVHDGSSDSAERLVSLSASSPSPTPFVSSSNTVYVKFHQNNVQYNSGYRGKFRLVYRETDVPSVGGVMRLSGYHLGRLEVSVAEFGGGTGWATVCDENFSEDDARVVCRHLGFIGGRVHGGGYFDEGSGFILLDEFLCQGDEEDITHCPRRRRDALCDHSQDVGVFCDMPPLEPSTMEGDVRLGGAANTSTGRLEIYHQDAWGTVCVDGFGDAEARVACRQLGFMCGGVTSASSPQLLSGSSLQPIWLDDLRCYGDEYVLRHCRHPGWGITDCTHEEDVEITCYGSEWASDDTYSTESASIRLVGGRDAASGVVEILHHRKLGTVCQADSPSQAAAVVACKQLGFITGQVLTGMDVSRARLEIKGHVWYSDLMCEGDENSLGKCAHRGLGQRGDCDPEINTLSVACSNDHSFTTSDDNPIYLTSTDAWIEDVMGTTEGVVSSVHPVRCLCRGYGDPIVNTYDDQMVRVEQSGTYVLSKWANESDTCWFSVHVTVSRDEDATNQNALMVDHVDISFDASHIRFGQNTSVQIGRELIDVKEGNHTVSEGVGFSLHADGDSVVFTSGCNVTVTFLGNGASSVVSVDVSVGTAGHGEGQLIGLCGDCDGQADDLVTATGEDVSTRDDKFSLISNSWLAVSPFPVSD